MENIKALYYKNVRFSLQIYKFQIQVISFYKFQRWNLRVDRWMSAPLCFYFVHSEQLDFHSKFSPLKNIFLHNLSAAERCIFFNCPYTLFNLVKSGDNMYRHLQ